MTNSGNNGENSGTKNEEFGLLFTKTGRKEIKTREMTASSKAKICNILDKRLPVLMEDLNLIAKSEDLKAWREFKKFQFNSEFSKLARIFEDIAGSEFNKIYVDRIKITKKLEGTKLFWKEIISPGRILDHHWKKNKPYYSDRIFQHTHILRGLKESRKTKELLMKANDLDIMPTKKEDALDKKTIISIIESINKETSKNSKCKTCGFKFSPRCPTCKKRNHKKFKRMIKGKPLGKYMWIQNLDAN